jgi:hypothetical protein
MSEGLYEIWLRHRTTGALKARFTGATGAAGGNGFLSLKARAVVNGVGEARIVVPREAPWIAGLQDLDQITIRRFDPDNPSGWADVWDGVYRGKASRSPQGGRKTFEIIAQSQLSRLGWYSVLWDANIANRTVFTNQPAETVAHTLVRYNATADATSVNGRDRNAPDYLITLDADSGRGNRISPRLEPRGSLLETLIDLQPTFGGDIDLVRTSANAFQFRFYAGQRGTDRRSTVILNEANGAITNVVFEERFERLRTVALVTGAGRENLITKRVVVGDTTLGDFETSVAARSTTDPAELDTAGLAALGKLKATEKLTFDILQTQGLRIGREYGLGDLVTIEADERTFSAQISAITYTVSGGNREDITPEVLIRD